MQGLCRVSKIKVLDEAFSHLDPVNVDAVGSYIARELKADVVLSTHVPEEAEWLGEYFIVLRDGRVAWRGTLEDLARENIYEVYVRGHVPEGLEVVASLGYVALVRASEDVLFELNSRGLIRGFRKAGVRVYYAGRA
jgi:ABC-2 type transport system ATP-binding protein